jgi:hypothetical protein
MLLGILSHGYRHAAGSISAHSNPNPSSPEAELKDPEAHNVAVIIPVTGNSPHLRDNLESLLNQDFRHYQTYLVTSDHGDPAVSTISELVSKNDNAHHIKAGHAVYCGQKNFNLLAGVKAAGEGFDILVFFDSSHFAPPTVLSDLLRPLLEEDETMTTGFHRVLPGDFLISTLGMMLSVLAIHLLQANKRVVQPWGGATAILQPVFMDNGIDRLWSKTVVDDYTLGTRLRKSGITCKAVPTACLLTPLAGLKVREWIDWLTRQLIYVKYYAPLAWLGIFVVAYLLVAPVILAFTAVAIFFFGHFSFKIALAAAAYLILWTAIGIWTRNKFLKNTPVLKWLPSFYFTHFAVAWCYIRTWIKDTVDWRGISYKMARNGQVVEVITDKT